MKEKQWLGPIMSANLLGFVADSATDRKLRMCAVGMCRVLESQIHEPFLIEAVQLAEMIADRLIEPSTIERTRQKLETERSEYLRRECNIERGELRNRGAFYSLPKPHREWLEKWAVVNAALDLEPKRSANTGMSGAILAIRSLRLPNLPSAITGSIVRDIFGNPFRPVTIDPRWLTSTVVDLAAAIYSERAFDRMPILADALMDAGCDSEEVIDHCRGPGPHVRGCWVVDLLLGKE